MDIDLVYTWCNGNDTNFISIKNKFINDMSVLNPDIRFENINEIYWSIQSVFKFIPFIRTIYIVTYNQIPDIDPDWIESGKVVIVDHSQIMPPEIIPCFFSDVIESYLHNIPNLSEIFIYNNDDCFHTKKIERDDIYIKNLSGEVKLKIINSFDYNIIKKKNSEYAKRIVHTADIFLVEDPSIILINNHHSKILRRSTLKWMENSCKQYLTDLRKNRFRTDNCIQYLFLALNVDHIMNKNVILQTGRDNIEYHFGNGDFDINIHSARFTTIKRYKWCCFNSMNASYKKMFENYIKEILDY